MGMVREVLSAEAALPPASIGFPDAVAALKRAKPDVVIIAYGSATDAAIGLASALAREMPTLVTVALAPKSSADAVLGAMRAGFKEFVVLPEDAPRLRKAVKDSMTAGDEDSVDTDKGKVIAFAGSKGGVGNTTLAANVAAELAGIAKVMLIDLDLSTGDVGSMLDVTGKESIAEVIARIDRLDERNISSGAAIHRTRVHALTTPDDPTSMEHPSADAIVKLIDTASRAYQFVILDCGTYFDEAVGVALNVADVVALVTTPDVIAVRDAFRRVKAWQLLGLDKSRVRLVVNRWSRSSFLQLKDIEQNLGITVAATVADEPRTVETALNEGKLIRDVNKKSDVVRDLTILMTVLTDDTPQPSPTDKTPKAGGGGGFFSNLFNRG